MTTPRRFGSWYCLATGSAERQEGTRGPSVSDPREILAGDPPNSLRPSVHECPGNRRGTEVQNLGWPDYRDRHIGPKMKE